MSINAVSSNLANYQTALKGNKDKQKKKGGLIPAVASTFVPGLGQLIDKRPKRAAVCFGRELATIAGTRALTLLSLAAINKCKTGLSLAISLTSLALSCVLPVFRATNIIDAYKGVHESELKNEAANNTDTASKLDKDANKHIV